MAAADAVENCDALADDMRVASMDAPAVRWLARSAEMKRGVRNWIVAKKLWPVALSVLRDLSCKRLNGTISSQCANFTF